MRDPEEVQWWMSKVVELEDLLKEEQAARKAAEKALEDLEDLLMSEYVHVSELEPDARL